MLLDLLTSLSLTSWLFVATVAIMTSYIFMRRSPYNLPPSPGLALPIIGHLYMMEKNPRQLFLKWRRQLGDIFTLQMGSSTVVVLSGYNVLKEALVKQADHFSDRPTTSIITIHPDGIKGILFSSGPLWKEQRSTALTILRDFGMGKNVLAEKITEEACAYTDELAKMKGQPRDIGELTTVSVSNIICAIIFGKRFELDDARLLKMLSLFDAAARKVSGVGVVNFFPALRRLPFDPWKINDYLDDLEKIKKFCLEFVEEQKRKNDPHSKDSFIAAYLQEMERKKQQGQKTSLDEDNLLRCMHNLFVAGSETTSNTILWMLLYCLNYPQVQEKIYQEIVEEIGPYRTPTILDKPKLKYLNAAIMETLRMASIVPFSLQHVCNKTLTLKGYTIPEGTQIVPHLDSVLYDEKIWGDPQAFRPERFIGADGSLIKMEEFVPFSLGRRVCMGEALAKMELFIFLSTMFQRFKFLPADSNHPPPIKEKFGITVTPLNYEIRCVERKV